jgi:hypothetical protein
VNGLEPTALLNQELDLTNSGKTKAVLSEDGKYSITGQKCGSLMQVSVLCLSYLLVLDDK